LNLSSPEKLADIAYGSEKQLTWSFPIDKLKLTLTIVCELFIISGAIKTDSAT